MRFTEKMVYLCWVVCFRRDNAHKTTSGTTCGTTVLLKGHIASLLFRKGQVFVLSLFSVLYSLVRRSIFFFCRSLFFAADFFRCSIFFFFFAAHFIFASHFFLPLTLIFYLPLTFFCRSQLFSAASFLFASRLSLFSLQEYETTAAWNFNYSQIFCNSLFFFLFFSFRFPAVETMLRWTPVVKCLGLSALRLNIISVHKTGNTQMASLTTTFTIACNVVPRVSHLPAHWSEINRGQTGRACAKHSYPVAGREYFPRKFH